MGGVLGAVVAVDDDTNDDDVGRPRTDVVGDDVADEVDVLADENDDAGHGNAFDVRIGLPFAFSTGDGARWGCNSPGLNSVS